MPFAQTAGDRARNPLCRTLATTPFWLAHADRPDRAHLWRCRNRRPGDCGCWPVGTVDGCAGQTAPPDLDVILLGGPDRGQRLRTQRGLRGRLDHPRASQRHRTLARRVRTLHRDGPGEPARHRADDRGVRDRLRLPARRRTAWSPRPTRSNTPPTMSSGRGPTAPSCRMVGCRPDAGRGPLPRIWAPSTTRTSVSSIPPVSVGAGPGRRRARRADPRTQRVGR